MKFFKKFKYIFICLCFFIILSVIFMIFAKNNNERVIRIGTTGDYQPISWLDRKDYSGFDIDIAKAMSKEMNAKIVFVKTTWKSLNDDLINDKFDVAMSGVSITKEREKQFVFSEPVLIDKKVAIIRCSDKNKLKSFNELNQKNVRIIENIGGTNEKCAKQFYKNARLILINNNKAVFSKIIKDQADAMITDRIEADYYSKKNPTLLCVVDIPNKYSYISKKAYMLRKDNTKLRDEINNFIEKIKKDNTLVQIEKKWLI
jgi:cyclohexadienyl dehydratase